MTLTDLAGLVERGSEDLLSKLSNMSDSLDSPPVPARLDPPVMDRSKLSNMSVCLGSSACPKWKAPGEGSVRAKSKTPGLITTDGVVRCLYHYNHDKGQGHLDGFHLKWARVLPYAAQVVRDFNAAGTDVTTRQLFYKLYSERVIDASSYSTLCVRSAAARREGWFPSLIDLGREIHRPLRFDGPSDAMDSLVSWYRLDRTQGQEKQIWLASEKHGQVAQLTHWFSDLGIPVLALGGYTSESYVGDITDAVKKDGRPAVLLYVGDADAPGLRIFTNFVERTNCWEWDKRGPQRIAITPEQVDQLVEQLGPEVKLPTTAKKHTNVIADFVRLYGSNFKVELDALDPLVMRQLYNDAIKAAGWNEAIYQEVLAQEERDIGRLVLVDYSNAYGAS